MMWRILIGYKYHHYRAKYRTARSLTADTADRTFIVNMKFTHQL